MADNNIEVTNLDAILQAIDDRVEEIIARVDEEIQAAGIECEAEAKKRAPVGTPESTGIHGYKGGRLRSSIKYKREYLSCTVDTNVEYAKWVEHGTRKMRARPFLHPAFEIARLHLREELSKL